MWKNTGRALGLVTLVFLAHPIGMALFAHTEALRFREGRYSIHLLPLVVLILAVALGGRGRGDVGVTDQRSGTPSSRPRLEAALGRAGDGVGRGPPPPAPIAWPVALGVWLAIADCTLMPAATRYAWAVQNINAMQVHLGHWVDAHRRRPRDSP